MKICSQIVNPALQLPALFASHTLPYHQAHAILAIVRLQTVYPALMGYVNHAQLEIILPQMPYLA